MPSKKIRTTRVAPSIRRPGCSIRVRKPSDDWRTARGARRRRRSRAAGRARSSPGPAVVTERDHRGDREDDRRGRHREQDAGRPRGEQEAGVVHRAVGDVGGRELLRGVREDRHQRRLGRDVAADRDREDAGQHVDGGGRVGLRGDRRRRRAPRVIARPLPISTLRRGKRSPSRPAKGEARAPGARRTAATTPTATAPPVSKPKTPSEIAKHQLAKEIPTLATPSRPRSRLPKSTARARRTERHPHQAPSSSAGRRPRPAASRPGPRRCAPAPRARRREPGPRGPPSGPGSSRRRRPGAACPWSSPRGAPRCSSCRRSPCTRCAARSRPARTSRCRC